MEEVWGGAGVGRAPRTSDLPLLCRQLQRPPEMETDGRGWCRMPVIPGLQEAKTGGWQVQV